MYISMQVILMLVNSCGIGLGYMVSCLCRSITVAPVVGVLFLLPFVLFGGLLMNSDDSPAYFVWIQYISPVKYGFDALMKIFWKEVATIPCNEATENCVARTGAQMLQNYSMMNRSAFVDAMLLLALNVAFRSIGFLGLWLSVRKTK
jgi:hypothetical protein